MNNIGLISDEELGIIKTVNSPIECLDLSVRTYRLLCKNGIGTIGDLIRWPGAELVEMNCLGWRSFEEIVVNLNEYGFRLYDCDTKKYPTLDLYLQKRRKQYNRSFALELMAE
jgi:DNA-directed RNA polymerase alpha subunit